MAGIHNNAFLGVIPKDSPRALPDAAAQEAENAELYANELRAFRSPLLVFTSTKPNARSAYRMYQGGTDYWLTWDEDVDAVKAPVAGDDAFRLYYTGDTSDDGLAGPKKTNFSLATGAGDYPADFLELGIPVPTVAPTVSTASGTGTNDTISYFYTLYSSTWDEEGPPSATVEVTYKIDGHNSVITGTATPGTSTHYAIDKKRIYRTIPSATGLVNWHRVTEVGLGTATYVDNRGTNTDLVISKNTIAPTVEVTGQGLVVSGSEWSPPPTDLRGLCAGANGMLGGFSPSDKTVCFCEPYRPHAWPGRYQYALPWEPVAMLAANNIFFVATKGRPYVFVGNHPGSMNQVQIARDGIPCVSKRSAALAGDGMLFSAPHGPALIAVGVADYIASNLVEQKEWARFFPDTIVGRMFNNRYFGFFDTGEAMRGFVFDPRNPDQPMMMLNVAADGLYTDAETAKLYVISGGGVYEWEGDNNNLMVRLWRSKQFTLAKPVNLGAYQVDADYAALGGDFAAEVAQIAAETAFNQALLPTLTEDWAAGTAGKIKGELGSHCLGGYSPDADGPTGSNNHGIALGDDLLVGGVYSTYNNRFLRIEVYAFDYEDNEMKLVFSDDLASSKPGVMYDDSYKSDVFEYILRGTLTVRRATLAETMSDLNKVAR